jgi:tetratricopeptide (TPR) repeat protein
MAKPLGSSVRQRALSERGHGLTARALTLLQQAARHLDQHNLEAAEQTLAAISALAPNHPEVLRLQGIALQRRGRSGEALAVFQRALDGWPEDALIVSGIASVLAKTGDLAGALDAFRRACALLPTHAANWFNLGTLLHDQGYVGEAQAALQRAVEIAPDHVRARIALAGVLTALGQVEDAAIQYRHAIALDSRAMRAWLGLADMKTVRFSVEEIALLERITNDPRIAIEDRIDGEFALGKACEDEGRYEEALRIFSRANAAQRRRIPWNAAAFSRHVDAIMAAATEPVSGDATRGREVIFVVSLPRAGSTLTEQILAAHPEVEGASELPDLTSVIEEESNVRGEPFPHWIAKATADDWRRLGHRYLQRTARWRTSRPRMTDKMPDNWLFIVAIRAMLPGARIVNCRRDPVETCWSCFKQLFGPGRQLFAYDFEELGAYWRDYDRSMRFWCARDPQRIRDQIYEDLLADPEREIRALLDFCDLPFDPLCLNFHQSERSIRTASAAQVREPLRRDTARSACYRELLDPLRRALVANAVRAG